MKKIIGIMTACLLLTASAWAGTNFSISVDTRGAVDAHGTRPSVTSKTAVWGDDPGEVVHYRPRGRDARRDGRIEILEQRLERQRHRIREGQKSGHLTPREARWLWTEFQQIEQYSQVACADRWLSQREWRNLTAMLDRSDREIDRLENNRRYGDSPRWRF